MRKFLTYFIFAAASLLVIYVFVTAKTYTQLGIAAGLYPFLIFFAYKLFMKNNLSQAPLMGGNLSQVQFSNVATTQIPSANPALNVNTIRPERVDVEDVDKRTFLKIIGAVGLSYFFFSLVGPKIQTLFFGRALNSGISPNNQNGGTGTLSTEGYTISEIDDTSTEATYYGFVNMSGGWFIMKENIDTNNYRYTRGSSNFSDNWQNRDNLKYDYYYNLF